MIRTLFAAAFAAFALFAASINTAQAGGSGKDCWAGYQYGGSYPCWAAEAFEPRR